MHATCRREKVLLISTRMSVKCAVFHHQRVASSSVSACVLRIMKQHRSGSVNHVPLETFLEVLHHGGNLVV